MFIRYNNTAKYWEYDTSAAQSGAGPWVILNISGHPAGTLPANVAYIDTDNHFQFGQTINGGVAASTFVNAANITGSASVSGGRVDSRGNFGSFFSIDLNSPVNQRFWNISQANHDGNLYFQTADDGYAAQANIVTFRRDGTSRFTNFTENVGGAYFPVDSSNAVLLDRYEEGVWTPSFGADVTAPTGQGYSQQSGTYIRVGRLVHVNFNISISTVGSGSGNLTIANLPFTVYGIVASSGSISYFAGLGVNVLGLYPLVINGYNFCHIYAKSANSTGMDFPLNYTSLIPGMGIYGSANYLAP